MYVTSNKKYNTSNTMSPGPRLTSVSSGRSIQPFGHNKRRPKMGVCPLFFWGAGSPSNTKSPGSRPTSMSIKFNFDPSNRLVTIHQRYRQTDRTDRTGQRCDCIGRTVLQTVAQKSLKIVLSTVMSPMCQCADE